MTQVNATLLADILRQHQQEILGEWVRLQLESASTRRDLITESELRQQSRDFLAAFALAISSGERVDSAGSSWTQVRELLARVSDVRARQGFTASETATLIFSKRSLRMAESLRRVVVGSFARQISSPHRRTPPIRHAKAYPPSLKPSCRVALRSGVT